MSSRLERTVELTGGLALLTAALMTLGPSRASACSMSMPIRHYVEWTDRGALALVDPAGQPMWVHGSEGESLSLPEPAELGLAAFSSDGRTMILVNEDFSDQDRGAGCMATFVHVYRVDLGTGIRTPIRRLRSAAANDVRINEAGTHALVMASSFSGEEEYVHVFDLSDGRRLRATSGASGAFLGNDRILIAPLSGPGRVVRVSDGGLVAHVPGPREGDTQDLLFGGTDGEAFWLVETHGQDRRVVRARIDGRRVRLERAAWTFRGHPLAMSRDARRLATLGASGALIRVRDVASGAVVARISGQGAYTRAAFSPDGSRIVVSSHLPVPEEEAASAITDLSAFQPATLEVLDLRDRSRVHVGPTPASVVRLPEEAQPSRN